MGISIQTGSSAYVEEANTFTEADFGYNYTGFRAVDRFDNQLEGSTVGLITWPGGSLAENCASKYGLEYDGLWNGNSTAGNLPELMALANESGAGLSIVLPTLRYMDNMDQMRSDIHDFMTDLLGGAYGPLPHKLIFEIGSEFYSTFGAQPNAAAVYGTVANGMIEEIHACLADPMVNILDTDLDIAVQSGRSMAEDDVIRAHMSDESFQTIDMVIHHRFALAATGIDRSATQMGNILDAWEVDAEAAGGHRPELFLGTYNVASYTRGEALRDYTAYMADHGHPIDADSIDMDHRTNVSFENFYQSQLDVRDYGAQHPRFMLEAMAEYGAEGMGAAGTYGSDMQHAGRLTFTDVDGNSVKFVGQEMLDMMAESIDGTELLKISVTNDAGDDVWVYGYENDDKLVLFLSADDTPPGKLSLDIGGLGSTYKSVWGDSLTAKVPDDWMTRFGVTDNARVDESPEAQSYAVGVRAGVQPTVSGDSITVNLDQANEVLRLSFAKTDVGAAEISTWALGDEVALTGDVQQDHSDNDLHDRVSEFLGLDVIEPVRPAKPQHGMGHGHRAKAHAAHAARKAAAQNDEDANDDRDAGYREWLNHRAARDADQGDNGGHGHHGHHGHHGGGSLDHHAARMAETSFDSNDHDIHDDDDDGDDSFLHHFDAHEIAASGVIMAALPLLAVVGF